MSSIFVKRKITAVAAINHPNRREALVYVVADDGTAWEWGSGAAHWAKLPDLPDLILPDLDAE